MNELYNTEAEQFFLASIIRNPDDYYTINEIGLQESDFASREHKALMRAITSVVDSNEMPTIPLLVEAMKRRDGKDSGPYIEGLSRVSSSTADGQKYAEMVKALSVSRSLGRVGSKIIDISQEQRTDYNAALAESERLLRELSRTIPQDGASPVARDIINRMASARAEDRIPIDFSPTLQSMTGGLMPGHFWVVGGFSSTGKSAFACNVALDALKYPNKNVAVISAEMTQEQYMIRLMSILSGVPQQQIQSRVTIGLPMQEKLHYAKEVLSNSNLYVFDNLYRMNQIRTNMTRLKNQVGLDIFILDYIQNISVTGDEVSDAREVALECQRLAKDLSCTVVAFSQLSNAQAKYEMEGGDENFYTLKGHGSIRDAADVVLTLHRDRAAQSSALKVKMRKNRHGPSSDFTCLMSLETGKIEEIQWDDDDGYA